MHPFSAPGLFVVCVLLARNKAVYIILFPAHRHLSPTCLLQHGFAQIIFKSTFTCRALKQSVSNMDHILPPTCLPYPMILHAASSCGIIWHTARSLATSLLFSYVAIPYPTLSTIHVIVSHLITPYPSRPTSSNLTISHDATSSHVFDLIIPSHAS